MPASSAAPPAPDDLPADDLLAGPVLADDAVARFLGGLWRLNRRLKQLTEPVLAEEGDLDLQRFVVLRAIECGAVHPKDLSSQLGIIPTQLSRLLDALATRGLLSRQLDPQDSRRTLLSVTPQGTDLTRRASHAIGQTVAGRLQALAPERLALTLAAIEMLGGAESFLDPAATAAPAQTPPAQTPPDSSPTEPSRPEHP